MPGLRLFGRRWRIADDDFVLPELLEGLGRAIWAITISVFYDLTPELGVCCNGSAGHHDRIHFFIRVCLALNTLDAVLAFTISWISSRGSLRHETPRKPISKFIYCKVPLSMFEFVWLILGTVWIVQCTMSDPSAESLSLAANLTLPGDGADITKSACLDPLVRACINTVILGWIIFFTVWIGLWLVFDPIGYIRAQQKADRAIMSTQKQKSIERRLNLLFHCLGVWDINAKCAFKDIATLLADLFKGVDVVRTDIWAGLMLVADKKYHHQPEVVPEIAETRPQDPPPDWMNLQLANRYFDFAKAIYGWPNYVLDKSTRGGLLEFIRGAKCYFGTCTTRDHVADNDHLCTCHYAAFRDITDLKRKDMFHMSYSNKIYEVPFFIGVDHDTEALVIALRGSYSLQDAITDLSAVPVPLTNLSYVPADETLFVHKGMYKSAVLVQERLQKDNLLQDKINSVPKHYSLIVTGHSLGAGVATILALILRDNKDYGSRVRCFAFSPPGCTVSLSALQYTNQMVFSLVFGADMVPRLSFQSMTHLKDDIIAARKACNQPKYRILLNGAARMLSDIPGILMDLLTGEIFRPTDEDSDAESDDSTSTGPADLSTDGNDINLSNGVAGSTNKSPDASYSNGTGTHKDDADKMANSINATSEKIQSTDKACTTANGTMTPLESQPASEGVDETDEPQSNGYHRMILKNENVPSVNGLVEPLAPCMDGPTASTEHHSNDTSVPKKKTNGSIAETSNGAAEAVKSPPCQLYVPGRIVLMATADDLPELVSGSSDAIDNEDANGPVDPVEDSESDGSSEECPIRSSWVGPLTFRRLVIDSRMLFDHLPYTVGYALKQIAGTEPENLSQQL